MHPDNDTLRPEQIFTADDESPAQRPDLIFNDIDKDPDVAEVMHNYRVLDDRVIVPEMEHAALFLCSVLPRSRHRSLALTALEEATHWAIAARKR